MSLAGPEHEPDGGEAVVIVAMIVLAIMLYILLT